MDWNQRWTSGWNAGERGLDRVRIGRELERELRRGHGPAFLNAGTGRVKGHAPVARTAAWARFHAEVPNTSLAEHLVPVAFGEQAPKRQRSRGAKHLVTGSVLQHRPGLHFPPSFVQVRHTRLVGRRQRLPQPACAPAPGPRMSRCIHRVRGPAARKTWRCSPSGATHRGVLGSTACDPNALSRASARRALAGRSRSRRRRQGPPPGSARGCEWVILFATGWRRVFIERTRRVVSPGSSTTGTSPGVPVAAAPRRKT